MEVIIGHRRSGKTTQALKMMRERPTMIMVCVNYQMVDLLRRNNRDIDPDRFTTATQVREGRLRGRKETDLLIEDIEHYLWEILGYPNVPIAAVTISQDG